MIIITRSSSLSSSLYRHLVDGGRQHLARVGRHAPEHLAVVVQVERGQLAVQRADDQVVAGAGLVTASLLFRGTEGERGFGRRLLFPLLIIGGGRGGCDGGRGGDLILLVWLGLVFARQPAA